MRIEGQPFTDVLPTNWYYKSAIVANNLGIVQGKSDGTFSGNEPISREQMAAMTYRAALAAGLTFSSSTPTFEDNHETSPYALEAIGAMQASGIIKGYSTNEFKPHATANRAEASVVVYQLLEYMRK